MKAVHLCAWAGLFLAGSIAVRILWPPNLATSDPQVRALQERQRLLAGYGQGITEIEAKATRVISGLWPAKAIDALVAELPPGWNARPLGTERKQGIALQRYAFSKDATLRDFGEVQRLLRKLEEKPSTRIDSVTLTLNADGKRFSTALITATLPEKIRDER